MVVFAAPQPVASPLEPGDRTIQAALDFAPGNALILAHLLWSEWDAATRDARRPAAERALDACSEAATDAGLAPPAAPWDSPERLAAWSRAWP